MIKAVLFDAMGTLFHLAKTVGDHYAYVGREVGLHLDAQELERALEQLLGDEARRRTLGQNAVAVVRENLGAIDRTVDHTHVEPAPEPLGRGRLDRLDDRRVVQLVDVVLVQQKPMQSGELADHVVGDPPALHPWQPETPLRARCPGKYPALLLPRRS